jgi:hypothetical protein
MKKVFKAVGLIVILILLASFVVVVALATSVELPGEQSVPAGYRRNQAVYVKMRDGVEIAVDNLASAKSQER